LFLQEEQQSESEASGIDKLMNLIFKIRNELWDEMKKLTKAENAAIERHKTYLLRARDAVNRLHINRAIALLKMGRSLTKSGRLMVREGRCNKRVAKNKKQVDRLDIDLAFQKARVNEELPKYQKLRAQKLEEIKTVKTMIKILKNLHWSGAVYAAIARITTGTADTNPEPGYDLGYQLDVLTGMPQNSGDVVYGISNADIKNFGRVAIKFEIGSEWVWASFDAISAESTVKDYLMPTQRNGRVQQRKVDNLHVHASATVSQRVLIGVSGSGNLEMWASETGPINEIHIPNAQDGAYDWGDTRKIRGFNGCFQVHDHANSQVLLSIVNLFKQGNQSMGIGNQNTGQYQNGFRQPDWTFANNYDAITSSADKVVLSWYFQPRGWKAKKRTLPPTSKGKKTPKCVLKCPKGQKVVHPACQCVKNSCTKICGKGQHLVAPCNCRNDNTGNHGFIDEEKNLLN
jgi:hypothetical protein